MILSTPMTPLESWALIVAVFIALVVVTTVIWMFIDAIWEDR